MPLPSTTTTLSVSGLILVWTLYRWLQKRRNPQALPLPPGPKGYPIIGNLLNAPTEKPWLVYGEWSKVYGDMFYYEILGQGFLVLTTPERIYDILDKRSSNYSDRPRTPMLTEAMEWTWNVGLMRYGPSLRRYRRVFHDYFQYSAVDQFHPIQLATARNFIRRLLDSPDNFMRDIRLAFASTIMKICYGITLKGHNDPLLEVAEEVVQAVAEAGNPGSFLVDVFPWMKYIPEWLPGAGWKTKARHWKSIGDTLVNDPWELVKKQMKEGKAIPSMASDLMEALPDEHSPDYVEQETFARTISANAYATGADTSIATIQAFFMAMCMYPEVQKRAQSELDLVLDGRLPEYSDRPNLPFMEAMVKECLRWHLVTPLGVPHSATEADEYNGYFIPKGTLVIANSWAIMHDPSTFSDPFEFNPERFLKDGKLNPDVLDPASIIFGFGRRICPGRHLSQNSMFILLAHFLSVYNISPALDQDGKEIPVTGETTNGLLSFPLPFACCIKPRSKKAEELIRSLDLMS